MRNIIVNIHVSVVSHACYMNNNYFELGYYRPAITNHNIKFVVDYVSYAAKLSWHKHLTNFITFCMLTN